GGGAARFAPKPKPADAKAAFKRIMKIYLRWSKPVAAAALLTLVSSAIAVAVPYLSGLCFDTMDAQSFTADRRTLYTLIAVIAALHIVNWAVSSISGVILLKVSQRLVSVLRGEFFSKLQRLPLGFFDTRPHGDTMSRLTNDADAISSTIAQTTTQLVSAVLTLAGSLTVMLILSVPLTLTVLVSVPLVIILTRVITKKSRAHFIAQAINLGMLNGITEESVTGLKMVKAFGRGRAILAQFSETSEKLYVSSVKAQTWAGGMMPLMNVINNLTFTLVAIVGGYLSVNHGLLVGTLVSFLSYSKQFGQPLNAIAGMFNTIQSALAGAERLFEVMDQTEEPPDDPDAADLRAPKGEVSFENVDFSYTQDRSILKNVSFTVRAGETVALVGETGAGKTTIVNLLTRFYDVTGGEIKIDGVPIRKIRRESLRGCFSAVLQETCLFSGTVMDNIRYGEHGATDEDVVAAAKLARAHDFIRRLPEGYHTKVTGSGGNLSEGQRQLLAIARAVLRDAPILILDEATSSVDTKTEKDIQNGLTRLTDSRTSFLIAHRLSTIRDADRIMVVGDGRILESGGHGALMAAKGAYYEMVMCQMGGISHG
ncbi:MAG: ABC transporter ATP-binding protein/permease, partial [Oscillospiraceae bacterium]|nr:ABC transporter ATP-binding protein/permease [Oscillospiraceae bacterium]